MIASMVCILSNTTSVGQFIKTFIFTTGSLSPTIGIGLRWMAPLSSLWSNPAEPRTNKKEMALIKCPKCGKEMSDRAASCPHCGITMEEIKAAMQETALNDARETSQIPLSQLTTTKKRVDIYIDGELFYTTELDGFLQHFKF